MSYQVKQGNIFGRIGEGLGRGLSEQLPKEIEHQRLRQGLSELEKESPNLDPLQFATKAYGTYGITPQMVQSLGDLSRSKQISNSLRGNQGEQAPVNPFKNSPLTQDKEPSQNPSLTTREPIEATLKNELAPKLEDIQGLAGQLIEQRPGYYANNPQLAVADAQKQYDLARQRNLDEQTRRINQQEVQNKIETDLKKQATDLLKAKVPGNVYSDIEQKAVASVLPKSEGGEGLTEQQAKIKYGKELDEISRNYEAIRTVGGRNVLTKTPEGNKKNLENIRKAFKERNDLENFADTVINEQNLSPSKAYYLAYKPSDYKELNNALTKLPELKKEKVPFSTTKEVNPEISRQKTYEVAPNLAKAMGKEGSPLAIYEELNSKNYDGQAWLDYLSENRKKLDLSERQGRELQKPVGRLPSLDDLWLFYFSGLEKLVEQ